MRQLCLLLFLAVGASACFLTSCGDSEHRSYAVNTFNMGEKFTLGHISYQVFETQWMTHIGQGADARVPQNRFFLVRMQALNSSGAEIQVPSFSLEDDNGNTYPELTSGDGVPQYIGYLRNVKPTEFAQGNALFDVSPRHYKLKVTDETGDRMAFVDIPLNFTSETPDVPEVGKKK